MPKFKPLPSREAILREFDYDPATGVFTHAYYKCGRALKGQVAGTVNRKGYRMLRIDTDTIFIASRAAWLIVTGEDPVDHIVDHKDRNKQNNAFSNLRLATDNTNQWNRAARGYHKRGNRYCACIRHYGKLLHIGTFDTPEEAQAAYRQKARELRGEFAPALYEE